MIIKQNDGMGGIKHENWWYGMPSPLKILPDMLVRLKIRFPKQKIERCGRWHLQTKVSE